MMYSALGGGTIGLIDSHVDINLIGSPTQWPQQHNTACLFNPHFSYQTRSHFSFLLPAQAVHSPGWEGGRAGKNWSDVCFLTRSGPAAALSRRNQTSFNLKSCATASVRNAKLDRESWRICPVTLSSQLKNKNDKKHNNLWTKLAGKIV